MRNRGADALAGALTRAGVKQVFTLSGNHIMPIFDAALANPLFGQLHLSGKQAETQAFREYLKKKFGPRDSMTRAQVEKQIREIALEIGRAHV